MQRSTSYRQSLDINGKKYDLSATLQADAQWRIDVLEDGKPFTKSAGTSGEQVAKEFAHKTAYEAGAGIRHQCAEDYAEGWHTAY
jgi:hypothetical protein